MYRSKTSGKAIEIIKGTSTHNLLLRFRQALLDIGWASSAFAEQGVLLLHRQRKLVYSANKIGAGFELRTVPQRLRSAEFGANPPLLLRARAAAERKRRESTLQDEDFEDSKIYHYCSTKYDKKAPSGTVGFFSGHISQFIPFNLLIWNLLFPPWNILFH